MLDCLTGYIGLSSESGTASSGLYLDTLAGFNLANVGKIADIGQAVGNSPSAARVFTDVEKRTIAKFRTLFINEFNKCHKLYKRTNVDCLICENKDLLAVALWYLMGVEMSEEFLRSDRINRYTTVDRQKIREQKSEMTNDFLSELATAVAGIDFTESECFEPDEEPECGGLVTIIETCP
ncbi:MAG: hypothetical protein LBR64_10745 [Dysgonamonadaceae bacterium]|jgi:hypothetical protein|nr:hypothetical protein [Dysgonamonadaceae bacterium]